MSNESCQIISPDVAQLENVSLQPENGSSNFQEAMALANSEADRRYEDYMLISWYDQDRNFESPQHATEGPEEGITDGYIHYALSHGATLKVDIEGGRFVFFYTAVEW
ncbi:MAG: AF1514 family protein [Thermodesulfobacteriota bacterium]